MLLTYAAMLFAKKQVEWLSSFFITGFFGHLTHEEMEGILVKYEETC